MTIKRTVMKFIVPTSVFGINSETLSGRRVIPCYISPNEFSIDEKKLITETFTKGGYIVEYWGEQLPVITGRGTTGSGGPEAVEILRSVYRNEQIQMEQLLIDRAREASQAVQSTLQDTSTVIAQTGVTSALDSLFGNGFSEIIDGSQSIIDEISSIFSDSPDEIPNPVTLIPSTGAFAVSVDLYLQGFKYRGYFSDFRVSESGESPGLFDYNFTFKVLRRIGKRSNFMPWHRNPYDSTGAPTEASIPLEGSRLDELTFSSESEFSNNSRADGGIPAITAIENTGVVDPNNVGISRFNKVSD